MSSRPPTKADGLIAAIRAGDLNKVRAWIKKDPNVINISDHHGSPLLYAASEGSAVIIALLLGNGADINKCDRSGDTPLAEAARKGHQHVVAQLISAGADVNTFGNGGKTPLGRAAYMGYLEIINILLQSGADINTCDGEGNTALAYAAQKFTMNSHIMRHLLSKDADANKFGKSGKTPLMCAAGFGSIENVKVLVENGADINIRDSRGKAAVDYAAIDRKYNGHIIEYLMKKPIEESRKITDENETFSKCIKSNNLEIAKTLIANEANVNKPEDNGETPLVCSVKTGSLEMVELLLNNGAQFSIPSAFLSAIIAKKVEIVHLLIKAGADVNLQYRNGNTPLLQAIDVDNLKIVQLLVENGADVNLPDKNGNLPLIKTVETQKWELAEFLILNGADVVNHRFLLIKYIQEKNIEMVKLLIEKGVSLDFVSDCGFTPLTKCVELNSYRLLDLLVQKGANVNNTDNNKDTPLSLAASNSNLKMFDYLVQAGADLDQVKEKLDEVAEHSEDFAVYLNTQRKQKVEGGHKKVSDTLSSGVSSNQEEALL